MRRLTRYITFSSLFAVLPALLMAGTLVIEKIVELKPDVYDYVIAEGPVISGSEKVFSDTLGLSSHVDYELDHQRGILKLLKFPSTPYLKVTYILIPPEIAEPRYLYQVREPSDSLFRSIAPRERNWFTQDGDLLISGAKTFALTFSEDDAFDLKQSLYVNLDGELSPNVNIAAQLSDSQSKLTPEGDSKELSSLDKVFIRVYGKQYEIAMGDLDWEFEGTRYINYRTSIEGLNAWYRARHFAQAGFTASGGKPAYMPIEIIDGKQGPYYLNPTGFQSTYLLIAGSERIYMDGKLLERGTDYYIDYSEGSVMFRTLVTSGNVVNAYFQYSDEYYKQSTYFNSSAVNILPGLTLSHHFIHQVDSKDNPLLYEFSSSDLDSLALAGDNLAWGNAAVEVGPGEGSYIQRITDEGIVYYQYAATDSTANYNVTFSFVGSGNGDYEEFSSGKFRYVGENLGAWLPLKRLVPAVRRSNADLALRYEQDHLELGAEGLFSANDKNTFSSLDDADNQSGFLHAYGTLRAGDTNRETYLRADLEKRWENSFLFTQDSDPLSEYDFSLLAGADSLSRIKLDLTLGSRRWEWWQPELMARYSDVSGLYTQKALRLISRSPAMGFLPSLDLRSTLSSQDHDAPQTPNSLMQYHDLSSTWETRLLKARLLFNYNSLKYSETTASHIGNRYYKFNPQVSFGNPKISFTQVSFALDNSAIQDSAWRNLSTSQTYALKNSTNTLNNTLNLDLTHREIQKQDEESKSSYDLISLRNSHYFLEQALMLLGNYQLNQTEFYPRIRELEYIGDGLGIYDSTGVYTPDGDYDYVYITSDEGTLSTETNAQLSLYLKPGNIFPAWRRLHSDIIVQATEQSDSLQDWRGYFFWPGTVYNEDSTIFGKQSYSQTLWLDIVPSRVMGNLNLRFDRSLDNRYQSSSRTSQSIYGVEMDLKGYLGNNYNTTFEHSRETDTRYMSDISRKTLEALAQRNLSSSSTLTLNLSAFNEEGLQQSGTDRYSLRGLGLKPGYRGIWGRKGRIAGSFGIRYNQRSGSDFLSFLPEKRDGLLLNWNLTAIYRLNDFSSITFEYTGNSYPDDDTAHNLKLEFKAEL